MQIYYVCKHNIYLYLFPIGVWTSLSPNIKGYKKIIEDYNLTYQLELNGTSKEGDWEEVFKCVKKCHEKHIKKALQVYVLQSKLIKGLISSKDSKIK